MKIFTEIKELQNYIKAYNNIMFVPTMGNLHEGHLSLVRAANKRNGLTVASVFVNDLQFGPNEDFSSYPRTLKEDIAKLNNCNVDVLFCPSSEEMFRGDRNNFTFIKVPEVSGLHCGKSRPIFFQGICTIITKLINIIKPRCIFLGEKDWQQSVIIRKLFLDLNIDIDVVTLPIIRESSGLALSSRNNKLSKSSRIKAALLYQELQKLSADLTEENSQQLLIKTKKFLESKEFKVDYINIIDDLTLTKPSA